MGSRQFRFQNSPVSGLNPNQRVRVEFESIELDLTQESLKVPTNWKGLDTDSSHSKLEHKTRFG